jgi:hypothetical protein
MYDGFFAVKDYLYSQAIKYFDDEDSKSTKKQMALWLQLADQLGIERKCVQDRKNPPPFQRRSVEVMVPMSSEDCEVYLQSLAPRQCYQGCNDLEDRLEEVAFAMVESMKVCNGFPERSPSLCVSSLYLLSFALC